jgi:hypothetical protein
VNFRSRRAALRAIGAVVALASADALAHSYTGLYEWALHHKLGGWEAMSWPAEIDVFLLVGELALYVAYLDGWPGRQRAWPWVSAIAGLTASVAGNVGHIQPVKGVPVTAADRLTAAASPVAAFAGLMIGLLVLKMLRGTPVPPADLLPKHAGGPVDPDAYDEPMSSALPRASGDGLDQRMLRDAARILHDAADRGENVSQRALASRLRERGHRFPNAALSDIASAASPPSSQAHDTT